MRISVLDIEGIQDARQKWAERNFGEQSPAQMMMGIIEEVGELAHHQLKMEQGIRGSKQDHMDGIRDAIGDIVMYLMGYCDTHNLHLSDCIEEAWTEIQDRDWKQNPYSGKMDVTVESGSVDEDHQSHVHTPKNPHHSTNAIADLRRRIQEEARPITDAPQA